MQAPRITIIVPCHDAEETVDVTLRSLAGQELEEFEVLCIDDCSIDGTPEILAAWAAEDARIRVIRNPRNLGIGTTRNIGLDEARGDWVGFVDADDWTTRTYFAELLDAATRHELDFVRCDHTRVKGLDRRVSRAPEANRGVTLDPKSSILPHDQPTMVDYPYSWAGIYRRSFLAERRIRFADGLCSAEDRLFTWRIHLEGTRYRTIEEHGYLYRREVQTSLTTVGDRRQLDFLDAISETLAYLHEQDLEVAFVRKGYRQALALLAFHFHKRRRLSADTWYEFKRRAADTLRQLDPDMLEEALRDFGERRAEAIRELSDGTATLL
jgi:glycosyltransferase involved in cell wall biosynthesis